MKCILCGSEIPSGEVCEKCKKDYKIPETKGEEGTGISKNGNRELTEGIIAIIFSIALPIAGFILGICFTVKHENKLGPIISIVLSVVFSVIYSVVFFALFREII